jgi:hypothetical protein
MIIGDFNFDVHSDFVCSDIVLDSLSSDYQLVPRRMSHGCVHNSKSVSNIDVCVCSSDMISSNLAHHDEDVRDFDHRTLPSLSPFLRLSISTVVFFRRIRKK